MFPDPHIMYDNGKFYIYATSMENDAGSYGRASVWVSEDFVNWEMQLTNYPVYGEFGGDIWAPDIVKVNDKYYQHIIWTHIRLLMMMVLFIFIGAGVNQW